MHIVPYLVTAVSAYLLGSIPFGYIAGRLRGRDIRTEGSGNIGATNAMRILGKPTGITVLVLDALKGFTAATWLVAGVQALMKTAPADAVPLVILGGVAAVLGHNYTCWLRFKGGKGIATSAGVLAAWVPVPLLIIAVIWVVLILTTRYVSIGSIAAATALPFACAATRQSYSFIIVTAILSVMAIYKHRTNIKRLLAGTETRLAAWGKGASQ